MFNTLPPTPRHSWETPNRNTPADISLAGAQKREQDGIAAHNQLPQDTWTPGPGALLVEANKPDATLAVIDGYGMTPDGQVDHGEMTSALAVQASGLGESNLLRVDTSGGELPAITATNVGDQVDQFIESSYVSFTEMTTQAIGEIHENHPNITTISQSQGISGPKIVEGLASQAASNPELGLKLANELGQPGPVDWTQPVPQTMIAERVQDTLAASPEVAGALTSLQEQLASHPEVAYFESAGNDGVTQDRLLQAGFRFDDVWNGSPQSTSPLTQSVGAAIPLGGGAIPTVYSQQSHNDIAFNGQPNLTLDGQPLPPVQGTSYAAPQAAGLYNASPQAYERLRLQALPSLESENTLGAGLVY